MSDGTDAMAEAARLEAARVYGQLQLEHKASDDEPEHDHLEHGANVTHLAPPRDEVVA